MVSYSTLIKTLCAGKQKSLALEYLKKMIKSGIKIDISVVNLLLENCSTTDDYKMAIDAYKFSMMQNVEPNEITFGIMIKIYGFARELHKAFDLLDLMNVY
jgi:pentatricopeptide repeat protein